MSKRCECAQLPCICRPDEWRMADEIEAARAKLQAARDAHEAEWKKRDAEFDRRQRRVQRLLYAALISIIVANTFVALHALGVV